MSVDIPTSAVALLRAMVGHDTVNRVDEGILYVEEELQDYLQSVAGSWGLATGRLPIDDVGANLMVWFEADPSAPWLMFDSHLDTVGVDGMTIDPFAAEIRDGRIYGRGTCDTKGTGAAMLWALRSLVAEGRLAVNIAILFSICEENGKLGVGAFVEDQLARLEWRPVGVIVGEATRLRMVTAHNGTLRWRIRTEGRAVHSSEPSQGRSAIRDMMQVIEVLESRYIARLSASHPAVGPAQCSINLIEGGTAINIIPGSCEIGIDRRLVPGEDPADVLPAVEAVLDELRARHPQIRVDQHEPSIDPPLSPESNREFSERVAAVLEESDLPGDPVGVPFGTHASNFAAAGLQAVVLGPGDIAQAHTADEFLTLDQFERGIEVYQRLMSQPPGHWQ